MKHEAENPECWCQPMLRQPCPECPVEPGNVRPRPGCWRCGGVGLVEPFDDSLPTLIIHSDTDDILRELTA